MKNILLFIALLIMGNFVIAQGQKEKFLLFELMRVDDEQLEAYRETEEFWSKIHQERVKAGLIESWDLWWLAPGGEDQGYQYLAVTKFKDAKSMFKILSKEDLIALALKGHYSHLLAPSTIPIDLSKVKASLEEKLNKSHKTRDLAARIYLKEIVSTEDYFKPSIYTTVARIGFYKVDISYYTGFEADYQHEHWTYKSDYKQQVKGSERASWSLLRYISPRGSEAYASHITFFMYKDLNKLFDPKNDDYEYLKKNNNFYSKSLKMENLAMLMLSVR